MLNELFDSKEILEEDTTVSIVEVPAEMGTTPIEDDLPSGTLEDRLKATLDHIVETQQHDVDEATDMPLADYRILLVDDFEFNRWLTALQLRKFGASVDVAENGQIAIDMIHREESENRFYDLVVMDMQMPVMDGYEATRTLRAIGFMRPILALTAGTLPRDREKTIDAGCNDYLPRPTTASDLLESIKTLLFTFQDEPGTRN